MVFVCREWQHVNSSNSISFDCMHLIFRWIESGPKKKTKPKNDEIIVMVKRVPHVNSVCVRKSVVWRKRRKKIDNIKQQQHQQPIILCYLQFFFYCKKPIQYLRQPLREQLKTSISLETQFRVDNKYKLKLNGTRCS